MVGQGNPYSGGGMTLDDLLKQNQIGGGQHADGGDSGGMGGLLSLLGGGGMLGLIGQHPLAAISPFGFALSKLFK